MIYFASRISRYGSAPECAAMPPLKTVSSGFAPGCEAGLRPAGDDKEGFGAAPLVRPSAERCRGKARTRGIAPLSLLFDSGRAQPCLTSGGRAAASTFEATL